jgi:DNA-binding CsgD family transcriptional regulator
MHAQRISEDDGRVLASVDKPSERGDLSRDELPGWKLQRDGHDVPDAGAWHEPAVCVSRHNDRAMPACGIRSHPGRLRTHRDLQGRSLGRLVSVPGALGRRRRRRPDRGSPAGCAGLPAGPIQDEFRRTAGLRATLVGMTNSMVSARSCGAPQDLDLLTARERVVLGHMAQGLSNNGISRRMFLSPKTLEAHVGAIFSKLGLIPEGGENRRVVAVLVWLAAADRDHSGKEVA